MNVNTAIESTVEVSPATMLTFPDGLFGFPECRTFSLARTDSEGAYWLQSLEHDALGFVVVDPFMFFEDFTVDLSDLDIARLQPRSATDIALLVIVTLGESPDHACSVNLQGPLAFNVNSGIARQVIQADRHARADVALALA